MQKTMMMMIRMVNGFVVVSGTASVRCLLGIHFSKDAVASLWTNRIISNQREGTEQIIKKKGMK